MIDLVAKRYVKALMIDRDTKDVESIYNELAIISKAFDNSKFIQIINSTEVSLEQKVELILSFNDKASDIVKNFIKILAENKRLNIIPEIVKGLKDQLATLNNTYEGIIYTNSELSQDYVQELSQKFAKKFNINLSLSQNICDYNGIKVDISGLGVEIGFSKERLKSQMIEHILKAV